MRNPIIWITALIFIIIGINAAVSINTVDYVVITVTDKERINDNETSKYLIYTDNEVFENTDSLIFGKFNSSDMYGRIKEGETYKAKVNGFRIKWLSSYRNILELEEQSK